MNIRTRIPAPAHPALVRHAQLRGRSMQNAIADRITGFAGSMLFVYLHVALFTAWMLVFEREPWPTLTLIVSLEAIFLSAFVMISQNRADVKRQVLADHEWQIIQTEEQQNRELLDLSNQILALTQAIHQHTAAQQTGTATSTQAAAVGDAHGREGSTTGEEA